MTLSLGIDFGTSGVRAVVIDPVGQVIAEARYQFVVQEASEPTAWARSLYSLLGQIPLPVRRQISRIAVNGTSGTVLLCDRASNPLTSALLYNDARGREALSEVQAVAPPTSPALSATSSLAKALWWRQTLPKAVRAQVSQILHQADWIAGLLHAQRPVSDYHNALKLGYDVRNLSYPDWLLASSIASWLPAVREPGEVIAPILLSLAAEFSLPTTCQICAGTTDSIAAFFASGACAPGEAVTSLGSTLVLKLLSPQPVDDQTYGIYSHRLADLWLVGGASNTGGAVLKQYFDSDQLAELSAGIDISEPCPLDYYPLVGPGERFPINDPDYPPRLTPRPERDQDFLYGLLSAIAKIEANGYQKLIELGASALQKVYTAGGGAQNLIWRDIRQRQLQVPVVSATRIEAAYGSAQLAQRGLNRFKCAEG